MSLTPARLGALALSVLGGGWMVLDGTVALVTGDYIGSELGPWAGLLERVGHDPLSLGVRIGFVVFGLAWMAAAAWYAHRGPDARYPLLAVSGGALWYLTIGTAVAVLVIILVLVDSWRADVARPG